MSNVRRRNGSHRAHWEAECLWRFGYRRSRCGCKAHCPRGNQLRTVRARARGSRAARCGQSVPSGQEPISGALSLRRSAASPTWKAGAGRTCRRGAGQREVVLAREVRRFATARSWSWYSCTLKAMNTGAANPLLATVISPWKRCATPSPTTPNPSIEGTCNIWLRQLSPAPHVKR